MTATGGNNEANGFQAVVFGCIVSHQASILTDAPLTEEFTCRSFIARSVSTMSATWKGPASREPLTRELCEPSPSVPTAAPNR